ncbi:hypothetical protein KGQ19_46535 [Catenulispora sp. NL8]|uniref:Replication activator protein Pra n=1 Tax=Catenulispora pinistramenti TaxID=2705254 RepID=A0ABS5L7M8_9ACTN|nr:hypothetical protein [Catenulispora pinistramenti]MBS2554338.1 hypothetical protein [Catenulispora pinistramenti]
MSLFRFIPVDAARLGTPVCLIGPEPKTDFETGEIKTDRDGNKLWVVGVSLREPGTRRAVAIDVTTAEEPRGVVEGSAVRLVGLVASQWEQNDRTGVVWRADLVLPPEGTPVPAAAPARGSKGGDA